MKSDPLSQESAAYSHRLTRNQQAVLDVLHQQSDADLQLGKNLGR